MIALFCSSKLRILSYFWWYCTWVLDMQWQDLFRHDRYTCIPSAGIPNVVMRQGRKRSFHLWVWINYQCGHTCAMDIFAIRKLRCHGQVPARPSRCTIVKNGLFPWLELSLIHRFYRAWDSAIQGERFRYQRCTLSSSSNHVEWLRSTGSGLWQSPCTV